MEIRAGFLPARWRLQFESEREEEPDMNWAQLLQATGTRYTQVQGATYFYHNEN